MKNYPETKFTCIGYFGKETRPVSAEQWQQMRDSNYLKSLYERIRQCQDDEERKRLKQQLPYWTPHCAEFKNNHRSLADVMRPQRRVCLDFDENKGRSQEICQKALQLKREKGWQVSLVEESARGGTHVIVEIPEGMTAREAAETFAQELGEQMDTSMLSIEHCLFMTPHTLYLDEALLFRDTFISEDDAKAVWTLANGKVKGENGKLLVSESRNKTCFDYAEQEQFQDDAVGLKVKGENGKLSTTAPDCPPETGGRAQSAEGVDNPLTAHPLTANPSSLTAPDCPPETGGRAQRAEGVDNPLTAHPLTANPSSLTAHRSSYPTHDENGCNLKELAHELIVKHCKNGHTPVEGERHTLLKRFAPQMALKCENNPKWLSQILPTYGLDETEFQSIVDWACQLPQKSYTPRALKETIERLASSEGKDMEQPPLPTTLPPSMQALLEGTPQKCQPAVAQAVLTALMLYLHPDVRFHCTDNIDKIPSGINIVSAPHASGKSSVNYPIDIILKPIKQADAKSELKEREWRTKCQATSSNKAKPKRPQNLCRQIIPTDITSAAFTQLLLDAKGKALYMRMDEIDQLLQLTGKTNPKFLGPIIRYAYDCAMWGQARVSAEAVNGTAPLNLKIQASTTPAKALEFFSSMLSDGTFDRITFSTITGKGKPIYGQFGEEYEKAIQPYIERIAAVRGTVHCPEAMQWAERMEQEQEALAEEMGIKAYKGLLPRAIQSAFFRAVMLYLMEDCKWSEHLEQFATWSMENDLWCKWQLFGQKLIEAQEHEDTIMHSAPRMRSRTLSTLPNSFSREDMYQAYSQQGKSQTTADSMLRQWKRRRLIKFDEETNLFTKTA